jgi:dipeptidyl aminopeptidase/acylaminoacyl peptidase
MATLMNLRVRKLILLGFALLFLIAVPFVILSTSGYRYNWKKGILEKTGIIKFVTKPTGARVWLDGQLLARTTPMSEFRLLPEDYSIRIEKEGYFEWKKSLEVRSGQTTFTEDVYLVRRSSPQPITDLTWLSGQWSPDGRRLAIVRRGTGGQELAVLGPTGKEEALLARLAPKRYGEIELTWSPDGRYLLFQADLADDPEHRELTVYPLPPTEIDPIRLTAAADGQRTASARWSWDGQSVTSVIDSEIHRFRVFDDNDDGSISIPGAANSVDAILLSDNRLLVTRQTGQRPQLQAVMTDGSQPPQPLTNLPEGQWQVALSEGDYLLLADYRRGQAVLYRHSDQALFGPWNGTRGGWERADGNGRLLLWNDFEISVWNPSSGARAVVTRLSSPIDQCLWGPSGRNVIFAAGEAISVAELDSRDGRNIYELSRMSELTALSLDPSNRRHLLYLGVAGNRTSLFRQPF